MTRNLFEYSTESLGEGATVLRGFALPEETVLLDALGEVERPATFRHMTTPGG